MSHNNGMTLLEVLVALVVISVGILAAVALQVSSLRASRQAAISSQLTELAQDELDLQRQIVRTNTTSVTPACSTSMPSSYSCTLAVAPCRLPTGSELNCTASSITTTALVAHHVTVSIVGPNSAALNLNTLVQRRGE